jgi:hypothetical protein
LFAGLMAIGFRALRSRPGGECNARGLELQGDDLRDAKLVTRKLTLAKLLSHTDAAIVYNEHLEHDNAMVFDHADGALRESF